MIETDRRGALGLAAALPLASALPSMLAGTAHAADAAAAQWDLTDLYPGLDVWDAARKQVAAALPRLAGYKDSFGADAPSMLKALEDISEVSKTFARVYVYASLKADEDVRVSANQERNAQVMDLYAAFGEATAWTAPETLKLGKDKVEGLIAADKTLATRFAFGLRKTLREAEHTLDARGEALLAAVSSPLSGPQTIREQLFSSDIPWPEVTLSDGRKQVLDAQGYTLTRDAPNRDDRKTVMDGFFGQMGKFESSLGAAMAAKLKGDVFDARARSYKSCLAMALAPGGVPEGVYRTLVAETNAGLPQLHRSFELRRKMLKLPDMHYYDIYPPLVSLERKFTLTDMRNITLKAVEPLGPEYVKRLGAATAAKWMDPWPRPGKRPGAYMNGSAYGVHPYLLLNLGENYEGLSTYAHEWGHAMHSLLADSVQPYELSDYPIFTAEIASTCNEVLLTEYMLKQAKTKEEKIYYLGMRLEGMRGTFFRQAMFAEFELKMHEMAEAGEGLSGESLTRVYLDLLKRYHGPNFVIDAPYAIEWAYIPHFYSTFYVYQYATSISAGTWFAHSILNGGKAERERYLDVLRAGGSADPVDILKKAGLDMTAPDPYRGLVADFKATIDEIETLMA
ncbi:M3 family oligoendopeptidase [Novosphingobium resinovorum]|uniref:M3 family oligoendopeptidase n=1 Tax=Novosphingobium TaxID=165696 RepID=UPI001B3C9EC2|nr:MULTISPECIES: M3 family oligoendopeptidase [Novosphingobium]MBF7012916.1 oligoendopeptidase F family protein [Novosphingobium sp. HR1a]WJM27651.1 M3 family oligoendopeptidase [Novosphingobium resinovorum]